MEFIDTIELTSLQSILVGLICLAVVWSGRPEIALGIYLSTAGWTRSISIGSYVHTWILLATLIASTFVYWLKQRRLAPVPQADCWIIPWMAVWWCWMLLLIWLFAPDVTLVLLRSLLLYIILPLPFVLLFGAHTRRLRGFATAYMITTMVGGWLAIAVLRLPLTLVLADPTLQRYGIIRLNIVNYTLIAYTFALSTIFAVALFHISRHIVVRGTLLVCAGYCTYFLILLGSRQSIGAVVAAVLVLLFWVAMRRGKQRLRAAGIMVVLSLVTIALYQAAPELILRSDSDLGAAFDLTANRGAYWSMAWQTFLQSPVWGAGFTRFVYSHNLFVGALADQGIVGTCFLIGYLMFSLRRMREVWFLDGASDQDLWRMVFVCVIVFSLIHSQASGSAITTWHLYWAGAYLWVLEDKADTFSRQRQTAVQPEGRSILLVQPR